MKSKTKIGRQVEKKTNKELVETIITAKKKKNWLEVTGILSGSRRSRISVNLDEINNQVKDGETILIPGKVLSQGEIDKKIKIIALNFSGKAKEKLEKEKIPASSILEEIKRNPEAKGIRILKTKKNRKTEK